MKRMSDTFKPSVDPLTEKFGNPAQDVHFQWTQAIHRDLVNLRDNHLAHIAQDLNGIKSDVKDLRNDVDELKELKDEAVSLVSKFGWKMLLIVVAGLGGAAGLPIMMEGM